MSSKLKVQTMAEMTAEGRSPEVLFWVGCAGSFDDRAQKITKAIARVLEHAGVNFAVLGSEESCTGDPAKRAGNEFLYQMHHTQYIQELISEGRLRIEGDQPFKGRRITFHDPCYLGRANGEYEAPRKALASLDAELVEMRRCKKNGLCCGAGGAQMFKDAEKGASEVNHERVKEALESKPEIIATGCPFCNTMMTDGIKHHDAEASVEVKDIAELIAEAADLL